MYPNKQKSHRHAVWARAPCFLNKAGLFNTPPEAIPPCANSKRKRWRYSLLWVISLGLTLYLCVLVYKAPLYKTDVIMGCRLSCSMRKLLRGSWITKMHPNMKVFFFSKQFSSQTLSKNILFPAIANNWKPPDTRLNLKTPTSPVL